MIEAPSNGVNQEAGKEPENPRSQQLTAREKWFVIKSLGLSPWLRRTKQTAGAVVCLSFAVASTASTALFLPLGLSYSAVALSLGVALTVGVIGQIAFRQEDGAVRDWKKAAVLGGFGAPVLMVVALNVSGPVRKTPDLSAVKPPLVASPNPSLDLASTVADCYVTGQSLATVYLANVATLARADLLASEVMEVGCARRAESFTDSRSCISDCSLGFRAAVKATLK